MSSFNLCLLLEMVDKKSSLFSDLLLALQKLVAAPGTIAASFVKHLADNVFLAIFDLEIEQIVLGEEEKVKLGPLIHQSFPHLENCIYFEYMNFPTSSFVSACYIRSGLQFLLDNYSNYFPKQELEMVRERILIFRESLDLDDLDDSLREYTHREFEPFIDVSKTTTKLEDMGLIDQHFWW